MKLARIFLFINLPLICLCGCFHQKQEPPQQVKQFPSPMVDSIREHKRIKNAAVDGLSFELNNILAKPVKIYVPDWADESVQVDLLIHFHGLSYVPEHAVYDSRHPFILATVNLGSGSAVYENPFQDKSRFTELVNAVTDSVSKKKSKSIKISHIYLTSFSAGYGSVRAIIKEHMNLVDGVILLDGLHTDYIPDGKVLYQGGKLNEIKLKDFVKFAQLAAEGKKKFIITHSEIFPGTYASTTETADFIIRTLGLKRHPTLNWGPAGMQLLSETTADNLKILAFAGNTAPDHIDHFHSLPIFLKMLLDE